MNDALSELDIIVESVATGGQRVAVRFTSADSAQSVPQESSNFVDIDFATLRAENLENDLQGYGDRLRKAVLAGAEVDNVFRRAMDAKPLRVRLNVRANDADLQGLHWETMTNPNGAPLSTLRSLAFSRYLPSNLPVRRRPATSDLRALVAVANPSEADQQKYGLAPIEFEQTQLDKSMGKIAYDQMSGAPVSMNRLIAALQEGERSHGGYDILYLVAHGAFVQGEPQLILDLENEAQRREMTEFRSGQKLAERMAQQLVAMPRLVVLASCTSAGIGMDDPLYATGPRLALAGVPAVMAMKGFVAQSMVESLMNKFFSAFQETPEVDRAMQAARAHVKFDISADDWWAPVLFMRLTDGRLASGEGGWQGRQAAGPNGETSRQPAVDVPIQPRETKDKIKFPKPDPLDMANYDRRLLSEIMKDRLSVEDLKALAFNMNVPYDDLKGGTKSVKVLEYILWCKRRNMEEALLDALAKLRPDQDWYGASGLRQG